MNTNDRQRLQRAAGVLTSGTPLRLVLTDHAHRDAFQEFGRALKAALPAIDLVTEISSEPGPPWMETAAGIRFHALPEGDKIDHLIKALAPFDAPGETLPPEHLERLARMPLPIDVRLYIAPGCPHCPQVLAQWILLARAGERLRLQVVDGVLFPEMARSEGVKAVPTLVVDDQLRWSGRIPTGEVLEQLETRDPARLSAAALDGIIKEGRAEQVARTMADGGVLFPAIVDLLTHDQWPVRLGAMVVMEAVAAAHARLAGEVVPLLKGRYAELDDAVRGDVLHVIGETGDARILPFLDDIRETSTHPEVRQAAAEAADAIRDRANDRDAPSR